MGIFGLVSGRKKGKGGKKAAPAKLNKQSLLASKSAKKKAKTCEFC